MPCEGWRCKRKPSRLLICRPLDPTAKGTWFFEECSCTSHCVPGVQSDHKKTPNTGLLVHTYEAVQWQLNFQCAPVLILYETLSWATGFIYRDLFSGTDDCSLIEMAMSCDFMRPFIWFVVWLSLLLILPFCHIAEHGNVVLLWIMQKGFLFCIIQSSLKGVFGSLHLFMHFIPKINPYTFRGNN